MPIIIIPFSLLASCLLRARSGPSSVALIVRACAGVVAISCHIGTHALFLSEQCKLIAVSLVVKWCGHLFVCVYSLLVLRFSTNNNIIMILFAVLYTVLHLARRLSTYSVFGTTAAVFVPVVSLSAIFSLRPSVFSGPLLPWWLLRWSLL